MDTRPDLQAPPDFEVPTHAVDREIYAMPAFVTLPVTDLDRAQRWYEALGFVLLAELGHGPARLLHLRRYRYQDLLLVAAVPEAEPTIGLRPRVSFAHTGPLDELGEMAAALRAQDAGQVTGPTPTPWHAVELVAVDADGHQVVLTAAPAGGSDASVLEELDVRMPQA